MCIVTASLVSPCIQYHTAEIGEDCEPLDSLADEREGFCSNSTSHVRYALEQIDDYYVVARSFANYVLDSGLRFVFFNSDRYCSINYVLYCVVTV